MKTARKSPRLMAALLAFALLEGVQAEDIDLFVSSNAESAEKPNVLIIIDNQSNWTKNETYTHEHQIGTDADGNPIIGEETHSTTRRDQIYQAVKSVLLEETDLVNEVNVGIMNLVQANGGQPRGGRVISKIRLLDDLRRDPAGELTQRIEGMLDGNDPWWKSSNSDYGLLMNEAYLYFKGATPQSGTPEDPARYDTSAVDPVLNQYYSPVGDSACVKNYVIFIATGHPQNDQRVAGREALEAHGGDTTVIRLPYDNYEESWADEFSRFMASRAADPVMNTYVIDVVNPSATRNTPYKALRAFWGSVAEQGMGAHFQVWGDDEIAGALKRSFKEILAVNSVFAASSLPVSVNVRGTNLNQVYMGVFRPASTVGETRWMGNLKLYKLALDSNANSMYLGDANGNRADSATTGFIYEQAQSYWTQPSSFWGFNLDFYRTASDAPDGDLVEKGGAGQQQRTGWSLGSRNVLTCENPLLDQLQCVGLLSSFTAASTNLPEELVNWVRGEDNKDDENLDLSYTDVRASIHGDVLHSRPAVLNYGGDTDIVVFYGSNDGHLRAVRGGFGTNGGDELWSFVAPEHLDKLDNLRNNEGDPNNETGKIYFMDGAIGSWVETDANGDITTAYIYPTMRRGGRGIYGFNVTNYSSPQILWRKSGGSVGWEELGQTWSTPKAVRTLANSGNPVVIFGGGYDAPFEDETSALAQRTMGRALYIVDAVTGSVVKAFTAANSALSHSVPGEITLISRSVANRADKVIDRAYFADTGGNVWRLDMNSAEVNDWRLHHLAALGPGALEKPRKFLFGPDVVYADGYDAILLGSGDREKPHSTETNDGFFMLKDTITSPAIYTGTYDTITLGQLYDVTPNTIQDGQDQVTRDNAEAELDNARGWKLWFNTTGEKAIGSAITLAGTVYFSTHEPAPQELASDSCEGNLGTARNYAVHFTNATATQEQDGQEGLSGDDRYAEAPGGGFVPSPVPVVVDIDGEYREAVLRGTDVTVAGVQRLNRRFRTYWFVESDD